MYGIDAGVKHGEPVTIEKDLDRLEVVVEQMFVINLIERHVFDNALHVEKLHHENAVIGQDGTNPVGHGMKLFEMEEDARGIDDLELSTQGQGYLQVEELVERGDPGVIGNTGRRLRGFNAHDVVTQRLEMLELRTVIGTDVEDSTGTASRPKS